MAQNRIHAYGTIFSRVSGLIKAKAMKYEDRPVWFDVYRAFPPFEDPYFHRKNKDKKARAKQILYPEDVVRAQFFKRFGSPNALKLTVDSSTSLCQMFVDKYYYLAKTNEYEADKLFDATCEALEKDGIAMHVLTKRKIIYK